jgi:serine-type D-Ala-D-Ala carboxypeptidase (penicillin-binding protein 5/6)
MYGPLLSVLLMGVIPVWGMQEKTPSLPQTISIAPPVTAQLQTFDPLDQRLTASGVIIVDLESGQTLYERAGSEARPMASLTKLMTALLIVENHDLDEIVTVPSDIGKVVGNTAYLPADERFTVSDLLSALLIMSGNDAAVTLAQYHSGSMEDFAVLMNERAKELGLKKTSYSNATGLDAPQQFSSPRDLAWLTMYVMRNEEIAKRMGTQTDQIYSLSGKTISLTHTHQLLRAEDGDILAGKTGTTDAAGQCLLSIVEAPDGHRYIAILLHSKDRYADMRRILDILTQ